MQKIDLQLIAAEIKSAQDEGIQLEPITARYPDFDIADAYQVANLIHQQRLEQGWKPVGRKIGFTNANMWSVYGVREPVWAYMYEHTVSWLGEPSEQKVQASAKEVQASVPEGQRAEQEQAECPLGTLSEPKIEPEIVIRFASAPPLDADPTQLLACIDWIAFGFEMVQSHFPDWKFQAADTIADRALHASLFIGQPSTVSQLGESVITDLEQFEIALSCGTELCETGSGQNVLGNPLQAILHLISVVHNQSDAAPIQAGEIITTGTLTAAFDVEAGQIWNARLKGIALQDMDILFKA